MTASVSEPFAPNERKTKAPHSGITGSFISPVKRRNEGHLWKDFCEDADHSRVQNEKEIFGKRCAKRPENVLWKWGFLVGSLFPETKLKSLGRVCFVALREGGCLFFSFYEGCPTRKCLEANPHFPFSALWTRTSFYFFKVRMKTNLPFHALLTPHLSYSPANF